MDKRLDLDLIDVKIIKQRVGGVERDVREFEVVFTEAARHIIFSVDQPEARLWRDNLALALLLHLMVHTALNGSGTGRLTGEVL